MRAKTPAPPEEADALAALGARLRAERERQRVSAQAAAETAGISRITLHRIERGEPTVSMGAWAAAAGAIGLQLDIANPRTLQQITKLPRTVRLRDYPELKKLAWQLHGVEELAPVEALQLYERNWRHVDQQALTDAERALIEALSQAIGGGKLLV
jgi:transcriptional regulator with XRE-family HTH domain